MKGRTDGPTWSLLKAVIKWNETKTWEWFPFYDRHALPVPSPPPTPHPYSRFKHLKNPSTPTILASVFRYHPFLLFYLPFPMQQPHIPSNTNTYQPPSVSPLLLPFPILKFTPSVTNTNTYQTPSLPRSFLSFRLTPTPTLNPSSSVTNTNTYQPPLLFPHHQNLSSSGSTLPNLNFNFRSNLH